MIAILATHPIQYQVEIWKTLAERGRVPFTVYYLSDHGVRHGFDPGFGRGVAWDIDLLGGYHHEFLDGVRRGARQGSFWWLRLMPGFGRRLRQAGTRVLWVQGWQTAAYWQAVLAAERGGIPVWMRGDTNLRSSAGGWRRRIRQMVVRRLLGRLDAALCVGEANRRFYLAQGLAERRLHPAPHCVANDRFARQAAAARRERSGLRRAWGIPDEAFCVLFVGKLQTKKRPADLVAAVGRLQARGAVKPLHLLFVGTGELMAQVQRDCRIAHLAADVEPAWHGGAGPVAAVDRPTASFAGFLNQSRIAEAYAAADCLALPSDAGETWGLVVNEAMASGLPCVASDACGCAEDLVAPIDARLLFRCGDIDDLARALEQAMRDPPASERLARHIADYSPARTAETVERLYAGIAAA